MHQKNVADRKRQIRSLKRQIREKGDENIQREEDLEQLSLSVAERKNINDVNGTWIDNNSLENDAISYGASKWPNSGLRQWVTDTRTQSLWQSHIRSPDTRDVTSIPSRKNVENRFLLVPLLDSAYFCGQILRNWKLKGVSLCHIWRAIWACTGVRSPPINFANTPYCQK